jgi:hypothetical protein
MPSNHKIFGGVAVKFAPFKYIAGKRLYGSPRKAQHRVPAINLNRKSQTFFSMNVDFRKLR